jgi:hypothetical protein
MKFCDFSFEPNFLLFKPANAASEIVSTKALRMAHRKLPLWQRLLTLLSGKTEPKIWRKRDRAGNWYFRVFDPVTNLSSTFSSEQEVRVWLEQRYYDHRD